MSVLNDAAEADLIRVLTTFNPWWTTGKITDVEEFRRLDFKILSQKIATRGAIALVGARQVGKTTLMEQLINHLLINQVNPLKIIMVRANNTELNTISDSVIKDCINVYEKYVLKEEISRTNTMAYVFIDEIQRIDKWYDVVRDYYDINKNIKFIVSGSSSSKIIKDSTKALVGRAETQIVVPFKFLEFLRFEDFIKGKNDDYLRSGLVDIRKELQNLMETKVTTKKLKKFFEMLEIKYKSLIVYESPIKETLDKYFVKGGYPAVIKEASLRRCIDILSTNIRDVVNTDIVGLYGIRKTVAMDKLLVLLSKDSSDNFNLAKISSDIEEDVKTLSEYVRYLEDTFIISISENYSFSKSNRIRKKIKKVFFNDIGIRNVINNTFVDNVLLDSNELGKIAETVVHDHCTRLKFKISPQLRPELFYWRDDKGEIDIIFEHRGRPIPIEVKYRNKIASEDLKSTKEFVQKYKSGFGICVSKNTFEMNGTILVIPAWFFLILC